MNYLNGEEGEVSIVFSGKVSRISGFPRFRIIYLPLREDARQVLSSLGEFRIGRLTWP